MALFSPEELEELRRYDAQLDETFVETSEEIVAAYDRDKMAIEDRRDNAQKAALERRRAYNAVNRQKLLDQKRAYNAANREKLLAYYRAYNAANREKRNAQVRVYQRKKRAAAKLAKLAAQNLNGGDAR